MSNRDGLLLLKRAFISLIFSKYNAGEGVQMISKKCIGGKPVLFNSHSNRLVCMSVRSGVPHACYTRLSKFKSNQEIMMNCQVT